MSDDDWQHYVDWFARFPVWTEGGEVVDGLDFRCYLFELRRLADELCVSRGVHYEHEHELRRLGLFKVMEVLRVASIKQLVEEEG